MLAGPVGGTDCCWPSDLTVFDSGIRPFFLETWKHATLVSPPPFKTHVVWSLWEKVTATGNWPIVFAGLPTMIRFVGSDASIVKNERVLSPGLTANNICG